MSVIERSEGAWTTACVPNEAYDRLKEALDACKTQHEKSINKAREQRDEARHQLQGAVRARDYCAGMLAAIDAEPDAPDIPGRAELLEDVLRKLDGK